MELTGVGLYTISDAGRLADVEPRSIRRWLHGYHFRTKGAEHFSPPLWEPQVDHPGAIGFRDLIELRFVREFATHGVHLTVIRRSIENARRNFGTDYPLTAHRFLTDGKRIFHEAMEEEGRLTDVASRQIVFESIIRPALYAGLEYRADGKEARRWYPTRSKTIVLDPAVGFGAPILAQSGVPVDIIADAVRAEGSVGRVARIFNIPRAGVVAAVKYEQRLAA